MSKGGVPESEIEVLSDGIDAFVNGLTGEVTRVSKDDLPVNESGNGYVLSTIYSEKDGVVVEQRGSSWCSESQYFFWKVPLNGGSSFEVGAMVSQIVESVSAVASAETVQTDPSDQSEGVYPGEFDYGEEGSDKYEVLKNVDPAQLADALLLVEELVVTPRLAKKRRKSLRHLIEVVEMFILNNGDR